MSEIALRLAGLHKSFQSIPAVADVSLDVRQGEFVSLLGPSGCGKTTTLRMIAGYIMPDRGHVYLGPEEVTRRPPYHRDIGMVFQSYALFPHMSVFDNVAFGLGMRHIPKNEIVTRVQEALARVQLESFGDRRPAALSGGQQQRVALARAVVIRPQLLLLDEPLSNLDAKLRKSMQVEIRSLQETLGITTIHVTHDQAEALSLSDRIVVMSKGSIQQIGTPTDIYRHPNNSFVADFIGEANIFSGVVVTASDNSGAMVRLSGGEMIRAADTINGKKPPAGAAVTLVVRPERIKIMTDGSGENMLTGTLRRRVYTGAIITSIVALDSGLELRAESYDSNVSTSAAGDRITACLPAESVLILSD